MKPEEIEKLLRSGPDRSLDGLELAIWRGVEVQRTTDRNLVRGLISLQALVGALAVLGGIWGGAVATQAMANTPELGVFSPHMELAPSSRLGGNHL